MARVRSPQRFASGYDSDTAIEDSGEEEDEQEIKSSYNLREGVDGRMYYGKASDEMPGYDESMDPEFDPVAFAEQEMKSKDIEDGYDSMGSDDLDMLDVEIREDELDIVRDVKKGDLVSFCKGFTPATVFEGVIRLKCVEESEKAGFGVCVCGSVPTYYCCVCNMITTCKCCSHKGGCSMCGSDDSELVSVRLDNPETIGSFIHDIDSTEVRCKARTLNDRLDDCMMIFDSVRDRVSFLVYLYETVFDGILTPSRNICTICFDRSARVIYHPCGHLAACSTCHLRMGSNHPCHMCRTMVTRSYVYMNVHLRGVVERSSMRCDFDKYIAIERMLDYNTPDALKRYIIAHAKKTMHEPIEISD
ncbi:hypothetical protein GUITHDRAFT_147300 [Guillardia theta CCMP2712]|uniref:RING-type domain-containing protein n=1 Tax=Guillardia theta (strain CCMP2712) TaxID=905079 RepID=L1IE16_GUITC|nr:hypothetical protein GUITHDRAFT_147300 [Guillardia theta CCMP2712]EKX34322.1 hypothetical protein GUITHDRAFT_147300 [Guillardia theta CCMP2712]|eukprot:XP_005821302.1 hypothetical protein GUITHDRAFT_147300 [Guillardia theta CCMP2712]